jgi:hypothetical protein
LVPESLGRAYLAVLNCARTFLVLYHLHQWMAPDEMRSRFGWWITAFKGEVHKTSILCCFEEEDEELLQLYPCPEAAINHATWFHMGGNLDELFHSARVAPTPKNKGNADR